jgi:hypothetical protein
MKTLATIITALAAATAAAPVLACGGDATAENLVVSQATKAAVDVAYHAAHPQTRVSRAGRLYYGRFDGDVYVVAPFARSGRTRTAVLMRHPRGAWQLVKETRARVACNDYVPAPLIEKWSFSHTAGRCFAVPVA